MECFEFDLLEIGFNLRIIDIFRNTIEILANLISFYKSQV